MSIGIDIISEKRRELNLDKPGFAKKCKVHTETIRKIENRRMKLHSTMLFKILSKLKIDYNEFYNELEKRYNLKTKNTENENNL